MGVSKKSTHRIYVAPSFGEGLIWNTEFVPTVTTGSATEIGETTAKLHGEVDPEISEGGSQIYSCQFEYVEAAKYNASAPNPYSAGDVASCSSLLPYTAATDVRAKLTGLEPSTSYHYRLVAKNAEAKEGQGADETFTTFGPPSIGGELSFASTSSATVKAQIDPYGYETTCEVQYVDRAGFEASGYTGAATAPCAAPIAAGFGDQTASVKLTGLTIGAAFHYRFVAHNHAVGQGGVTIGADHEFSTFGIESFSIETIDEHGNPYTQAGGHPYEMRIQIALTKTEPVVKTDNEAVTGNLRTVKVKLPPGLIIDPAAVQKCSAFRMAALKCEPEAQIGSMTLLPARLESAGIEGKLYNLIPPEGIAAQIGGRFSNVGTVRIDGGVRTGSDYGLEGDTLAISAQDGVSRIKMTLWGVPADKAALVPFLTNPTSCAGPLSAGLSIDTWQEPGDFVSKDATMGAIGGCDQLEFEPTIEAQPTAGAADSPSGLKVDLKVPQHNEPCEVGPPVQCSLAEANLKDAVVTLPAGLTVDPSSADGLEACSEEQVGYLAGKSAEVGHPQFTPEPAELPGGLEARLGRSAHAAARPPDQGRRVSGRAGRQPVQIAAGAVHRRARSGERRGAQAAGRSESGSCDRSVDRDVRPEPATAVRRLQA